MLNTGLHVASKKLKKANTAAMTLEEYISNTRLGVDCGFCWKASMQHTNPGKDSRWPCCPLGSKCA